MEPTEAEWLSVLSNMVPTNILREESAWRECKTILSNNVMSASIVLRQTPFWPFFYNSMIIVDLNPRFRSCCSAVSVYNKQLAKIHIGQRRIWLRVLTGQECCTFPLHRWNVIELPFCQCGEVQTVKHLVAT